MEPQRVLIVEPVPLKNGLELSLWTYVWKLTPSQNGFISIEHRNREYQIPAQCAVDVPVAPPLKKQLCSLDPCFPMIPTGFEEVYVNETSYFTVHRCPHGNYFLEDVRGGIGMFSLWIFLGPVENQEADCWESFWTKFHYLPVDAIFYLGIGC